MSLAADPQDLVVTVAAHGRRPNGFRPRELLEWLIERCTKLGWPPTHLAISEGEKIGRYRRFARAKEHEDQWDWGSVSGFAIKVMRPDRDFPQRGFFDWSIEANATARDRQPANQWTCDFAIVPSDTSVDESAAIALLTDFAGTTVGDYGYLFRMRRGCAPTGYVGGMGAAGCERTNDEAENVGAWGMRPEHFAQALLRDIYPLNFLGRRYLELIVEGGTLRDWILAAPKRGSLEPLSGNVTIWRPVPQSISQIREALYRAGIMFYWRFFDPFDPMCRDFGKPWDVPREIPEMFRAEFHAGRDPSITR